MTCSFDDFRCKEIINIKTGVKIGYPDDIEFETHTAKVCKIIVFGRAKFFGLFGREADLIIPWSDIDVIGEDTILISGEYPERPKKAFKSFENLLK